MLQISQWPRQRKVDNAFYILKKQLRKDTERENKKKLFKTKVWTKIKLQDTLPDLCSFIQADILNVQSSVLKVSKLQDTFVY